MSKNLKVILVTLIFLAIFIPEAISADKTWNNSASGSWNLSTNWGPAGIPTLTDNVNFYKVGVALTVTISSPAACSTLKISIDNLSAHTLSLDNNTGLSAEGNITVCTAGGTPNRLLIGNNTINIKGGFYSKNKTLIDSNGGTISAGGDINCFTSCTVTGAGTFICKSNSSNQTIGFNAPTWNFQSTNSAGQIYISDTVKCSSFTISAGTFNQSGYDLFIYGNISIDSNANFIKASAGKKLYINSSAGIALNPNSKSSPPPNNSDLGDIEIINSGTSATLISDVRFSNLTITNSSSFICSLPSKNIWINGGGNLNIYGSLSLTGASGGLITVESISGAGNLFNANCYQDSTINLSFIDIKYFNLNFASVNNPINISNSSISYCNLDGSTQKFNISNVTLKGCSWLGSEELNATNGCTDDGENYNIDLHPPAAISDLIASQGLLEGQIVLKWRAVGDDNSTGNPASSYTVKYSTSPIVNQTDFDSASTFVQNWTPIAPSGSGSIENKTLNDFPTSIEYYFAIEAVDNVGAHGNLSNEAHTMSKESDKIPPSNITDIELTFYSKNSSLLLTWAATGDDNSIGTAYGYLVKYSSTPILSESQFNSATIYSQRWIPAVPGTAESKILSGINIPNILYFAIKAYDENNNYSGLSSFKNFKFKLSSETSTEFQYSLTNGGKVKLEIPKGSFKTDIDLVVPPINDIDIPVIINQTGLKSTGIAAKFQLSVPKINTVPLTLTFFYENVALDPGINKNNLGLARYNESAKKYNVIPSSHDKTKNSISASLYGLSMFQILEISASYKENFKVFPNPYKPGTSGLFDGPGITFKGLSSNSIINIYILPSGEFVKKLETTESYIVWDTTNEKGQKIASGVYLYIITNSDGSKTRGKLTIIR